VYDVGIMSNDLSRKEKLIKRLRYLWTWELFDSLFLPAVVIFASKMTQRPIGLVTLYSAGLVAWLLWQGAAYWRLKLRAVKTGSPIATSHLRRFAALKRVNWALIGALPVLLVGKGLTGAVFRSGLDLVAGLGFYGLAVLEHVNYYYYQLMYDSPPDWRYLIENKALKRSSLNRALERCDLT
jgi:hypothetical protein